MHPPWPTPLTVVKQLELLLMPFDTGSVVDLVHAAFYPYLENPGTVFSQSINQSNFYCAMHARSTKCGIAIVGRTSVCLSVCNVDVP